MTSDSPIQLDFKFLHVGVAVSSLDQTTALLSALLGYKVVAGPFNDPVQKVTVNFLAKSDKDLAEIELIAPAAEDSPIRSILNKTGGGAYHLCFETNDIDAAVAHAGNMGCVIVASPVPAVAFEGRRIAWIYTPSRQLFELVESKTAQQAPSPE